MDRARPRAVRGASVSSLSDSDALDESIDEGRLIRTARAVKSNTSGSNDSSLETDADGSSNESQSDREDEDLDPDPATQAKYLSFGALASAQASILGKRTRDQSSSHRHSHDNDDEHGKQKQEEYHQPTNQSNTPDRKPHKPQQRPQIPARSSKHAPTEVSSKKAVSRKRPVISDTTISTNAGQNSNNSISNSSKPRARDPRFHSVSGPLNHAQVEANYAFLSDYRATELASLRAALAKQKKPTTTPATAAGAKTSPRSQQQRQQQQQNPDPETLQTLQAELRRRESQHAALSARAAERAVHAAHRRAERDKVARGKKPFYLKASAAKRAVLAERFRTATPRERERMVERRRKKKVALERKRAVVPDQRRRRTEDGLWLGARLAEGADRGDGPGNVWMMPHTSPFPL